MYFKDRKEAGKLLAKRLHKYRFEESEVIALSAGGVQVGEQIAKELACPLSLLVVSKIPAMGDSSLILGTIDQEGDFSYNELIPAGEMSEYLQDMTNYLEEEKLHKLYDMAQLLGQDGLADRATLDSKNVIVATDGVNTGMSFHAATQFLKPVRLKRLIGAVPVGPADTIDQINLEVDELHYLYIPDNFFDVNHYYDDNNKPEPSAIMASINLVTSHWK